MRIDKLDTAIRERSTGQVLDFVTTVLTAIRDGTSNVLAVRHPLGFDCLPVHRVGSDGICVHVWPERRRPPNLTTSPFHCHSWDLLSHVLYGAVGNQHIEVTAGATFAMFDVQSMPDGDRIIPTGRRVNVRAAAPVMYGVGDFYQLPAGEFHASIVNGAEAATVVLGRQRSNVHDVTLGALDTPGHKVERSIYTAEETGRIVTDVLRRVTQGSAVSF